ncbi:Ig-like domain-containing protein [Actinomadura sp. 6N118]|uniref:L,D-transpeptidase n=1 Tax=Actinomadura sp. 6N118 TaxID=3375151 RepID=UPI00379E4AB7
MRPDLPITVQAVDGKIRNVTVTAKGRSVEGVLSEDGTVWRSRWTLAPGTAHQVAATVQGRDGEQTTRRASFITLKPAQTVHADAQAPSSGEKVGVGMPIILNFNRPVYNQAEVERALQVKASKTTEGAWRWTSRQEIVYRPRRYWTPGEQVTVNARLTGVRAAKGTYGDRDLNFQFAVGDEVISTVNTKAYTMTVKRNGKVTRKAPISAGRATKRAYTTTNGVHLTMSKEYKVVADSATVGIPKGDPEYYKLDLYWAIRISNSGEYVHSAPWSVGDQGKRNVSHGCVNASPKNAKWFYQQAQRGDVVIVTGTDRELEWNNGWGFWQMPWERWKKGGAAPESAAPVQPPTG